MFAMNYGGRRARLATIIGRISLAMVGSLCAVFVAAFISRANIAALNSVGIEAQRGHLVHCELPFGDIEVVVGIKPIADDPPWNDGSK